MGTWFDNLPDELQNSIMKVRVVLPDKEIEYDFRPEIVPDYDRLEEQLQDTPQQFVFWSSVFAEQKAKVSILERELLMAKSKSERLINEELRRHDNAKLGRPEVTAIIELNDNVHRISCQLIEEEKKLYKLKSIVEALKMKSEHLRSLAGFKREEHRAS
jgi:hypothetical protein